MVVLPARTTPSITQRKPWKRTQWVAEGRLAAVCGNLFNIHHRIPDPVDSDTLNRFTKASEIICKRWAHAMRLSEQYAYMPVTVVDLA